jgi:hypothetical protein
VLPEVLLLPQVPVPLPLSRGGEMSAVQKMQDLFRKLRTASGAEADQVRDDMDALWFSMNHEQQEEALESAVDRDAIREGI